MIMKDEFTEKDKTEKDHHLIHEQSLDDQLSKLFWAFAKGDDNYIYEFDSRTYKVREQFLNESYKVGFTAACTLFASNYMFAKIIRPRADFPTGIRIGLLAAINLLPASIFTYQGYKLYLGATDYLFQKYLVAPV